jgi:predicted transcriptional regulator
MNIGQLKIINFVKDIDFDYWCNSKIDIIINLLELKEINSISEMSRLINRSFSVTHKHITDLCNKKIIKIIKKSKPKTSCIMLYNLEWDLNQIIKK